MIYWIAISAVLLVGYVILMCFYYIGWMRTKAFFPPKNFIPNTKVSVIIAARNEEFNIRKCLRSILDQNYPKDLLEIIVVDDNSEDRTLAIAKTLTKPCLHVLSLPELTRGESTPLSFKKKAIGAGIKSSTGDLIITTDADCIAKPNWLLTIVAYYEQFQPKMVAAPVAFTNEKLWLEKWQSLDLCGLIAITAGSITNNFPNMCNGANLAYERKVFEEVGGFNGIDNLPSGDDVMLMMKINKAHPGGVHFLKSTDAVVYTQPVKTLAELFQQRLRWLSKGTAFPDWRVSATLVAAWLFNLSLLINFFGGFAVKELWWVAGILIVIKTLAELPLLAAGCAFFNKKVLLWQILPVQILHVLYVVIVGGASRFYKYNWKGRSY